MYYVHIRPSVANIIIIIAVIVITVVVIAVYVRRADRNETRETTIIYFIVFIRLRKNITTCVRLKIAQQHSVKVEVVTGRLKSQH